MFLLSDIFVPSLSIIQTQGGGSAHDLFFSSGFIHKEYIISPLTSIINFRHFLSFLAFYSKLPTLYFTFYGFYLNLECHKLTGDNLRTNQGGGSAPDIFRGSGFIHKKYIMSPVDSHYKFQTFPFIFGLLFEDSCAIFLL